MGSPFEPGTRVRLSLKTRHRYKVTTGVVVRPNKRVSSSFIFVLRDGHRDMERWAPSQWEVDLDAQLEPEEKTRLAASHYELCRDQARENAVLENWDDCVRWARLAKVAKETANRAKAA